jgi:hypothetical protein
MAYPSTLVRPAVYAWLQITDKTSIALGQLDCVEVCEVTRTIWIRSRREPFPSIPLGQHGDLCIRSTDREEVIHDWVKVLVADHEEIGFAWRNAW